MNKEHILDEIRRTTKSNDGVPLGWRAFYTETGIKESDWLGKFWARWNDAVKEAGFVPNQLTVAYDEEWLFDRYLALARELGRLPTNGDLRLKSRHDRKFPSSKTFDRFGPKAEFVTRLTEFCRTHGGYEDALVFCEEYAPRRDERADSSEPAETEMGFVYLMKSGRFYKIGRSNAAGRREYELAIQLPEKIKTIHIIRTDDPPGIEAYWHKRFAAKLKNSEWFDLDAADVAAFRRRKFM